jgi:hypothetical protein
VTENEQTRMMLTHGARLAEAIDSRLDGVLDASS